MSDVTLSPETLLEFEKIVFHNVTSGQGLQEVLKPAREFCEEQGWDWFTAGKKADFNRRFGYVYRAYSSGIYANQRQEQHADMTMWVYKADPFDCPDHADDLGGLILPRDHGFWGRCYPPIRPTCSCYVVGARTEQGAVRLGGKIGKEPPAWATDFDGSFTFETLVYDVLRDNLPSDD